MAFAAPGFLTSDFDFGRGPDELALGPAPREASPATPGLLAAFAFARGGLFGSARLGTATASQLMVLAEELLSARLEAASASWLGCASAADPLSLDAALDKGVRDRAGDALREFMGRTGAFKAVPVDVRRGKLCRTRSGSIPARWSVASVDLLRTRLGRGGISGGGSEGSRLKPKGELLARRETGRSECLGLNCPSVRSYQTASARPKRSLV